jgi:hypothetical protein
LSSPDHLILKRASASRPSGAWNDEGFDALCEGAVVGLSRGELTRRIQAVVDTDTHQSDLGPKSTRAGADGTQARARLSRSKRP